MEKETEELSLSYSHRPRSGLPAGQWIIPIPSKICYPRISFCSNLLSLIRWKGIMNKMQLYKIVLGMGFLSLMAMAWGSAAFTAW